MPIGIGRRGDKSSGPVAGCSRLLKDQTESARGEFYGKNVISGVYSLQLLIFGAGSGAGDSERQRNASEPGEEYLAPIPAQASLGKRAKHATQTSTLNRAAMPSLRI